MYMKATLTQIIIPAIGLLLVATLIAIALVTMTAIHAATPALPPCVEEDGSGGPTPCVWDASTRGNGIGTSYTIEGN